LRDFLTREARTSRQRLSDTANTRGFLDSGQVFEGIEDIERGKLEAFSRGITELVMDLDRRGDQLALPFLGAASQENLAVQGANQQAQLGQRGQNLGFASNMTNLAAGLTGGGISNNDQSFLSWLFGNEYSDYRR
jgi:hypothetical protein